MTAVTTFRLNHKLCSKCLVCRKSCSITYVSHYRVNLQKNKACFFCRGKAKPCISCYLLCTCSPVFGSAKTKTRFCSAAGGAAPACVCLSHTHPDGASARRAAGGTCSGEGTGSKAAPSFVGDRGDIARERRGGDTGVSGRWGFLCFPGADLCPLGRSLASQGQGQAAAPSSPPEPNPSSPGLRRRHHVADISVRGLLPQNSF